ncbi:hypothetical protein DXG01_001295 [Tephrocybe rancida]|nr:hypothetical protein DXG01_001295 [Tephrocybe rancida]
MLSCPASVGSGKKTYYSVVIGQRVGVFMLWSEVKPLVNGLSGAIQEKFPTWDLALGDYMKAFNAGTTQVRVLVDGPYYNPVNSLVNAMSWPSVA